MENGIENSGKRNEISWKTERVVNMNLTPQGYIPRLADAQLEERLKIFGAVQVNGAKWCGKTWTCKTRAQSEILLDDPGIAALVNADLSFALSGEEPHLIDEWQKIPAVRDRVRRAVDESGSKPGRFMLTGSSDPKRDSYSHGGGGRIGELHMRPMSLFETGISNGEISLAALFEGFKPEYRNVSTNLELLASWICRGGWPGALQLDEAAAFEVPAAYLDEVTEDNFTQMKLNPELARRIILQIARTEGQLTKISTFAAALGLEAEGISSSESARKTVATYLDALERLYLIEPLYGWAPPFKSRKRLRVNPKRYLCDPSLSAAAMGASPERLLSNGQLFGMLFESLCLRDIRIYADAVSYRARPALHYYHDNTGLECDVVLERRDGSWGAIEIKLGDNGVPAAEESLLKLKRLVTDNPLSQIPEPSFLLVLVGASTYLGTLPSGVCVVPITYLGR